jgi:hypothetical protein
MILQSAVVYRVLSCHQYNCSMGLELYIIVLQGDAVPWIYPDPVKISSAAFVCIMIEKKNTSGIVVYRCDLSHSVSRSIGGWRPARVQRNLFVGERARIDHLIRFIFIIAQHLEFFRCPVKELCLSYTSQESCPADRSYVLPKPRRRANCEIA